MKVDVSSLTADEGASTASALVSPEPPPEVTFRVTRRLTEETGEGELRVTVAAEERVTRLTEEIGEGEEEDLVLRLVDMAEAAALNCGRKKKTQNRDRCLLSCDLFRNVGQY